jgi:imidazolonepropionase-like amidohydrolase
MISDIPTADPNRTTAIRAARVLNVETGKYEANRVIVIEDGRIKSIGDSALVDAHFIDLGDRVVLPGLIDAHTHILIQGTLTIPDFEHQLLEEYPAHRVVRAVRAVRIALDHGFTTMRDLETEGAGYDDVAIRDAIREGVILGPRLQVSGWALSPTGSYPISHFRPDWTFPSGVGICDGPDECRATVRRQLSYGIDWIKVYVNRGPGERPTSDGYIDSAPNWTREELDAIVSEAQSRGARVAAHATSDTGVRMAIDAGVESIEHGYSIRPEAAREMADKGIVMCPTLTASDYMAPPRIIERGPIWGEVQRVQRRSVENCLTAGVKIAFGTDAGGFPWTEINQANEFRHLVAHGLSPLDALRSATVIAADLLDLTGEVGVIKPGAIADLVAVTGDPLADVSCLMNVDFVMQSGRIVKGSGAAT